MQCYGLLLKKLYHYTTKSYYYTSGQRWKCRRSESEKAFQEIVCQTHFGCGCLFILIQSTEMQPTPPTRTNFSGFHGILIKSNVNNCSLTNIDKGYHKADNRVWFDNVDGSSYNSYYSTESFFLKQYYHSHQTVIKLVYYFVHLAC